MGRVRILVGRLEIPVRAVEGDLEGFGDSGEVGERVRRGQVKAGDALCGRVQDHAAKGGTRGHGRGDGRHVGFGRHRNPFSVTADPRHEYEQADEEGQSRDAGGEETPLVGAQLNLHFGAPVPQEQKHGRAEQESGEAIAFGACESEGTLSAERNRDRAGGAEAGDRRAVEGREISRLQCGVSLVEITRGKQLQAHGHSGGGEGKKRKRPSRPAAIEQDDAGQKEPAH